MAFAYEDGTAIDGANSFVSLDYADLYHSERGNTAWSDLDGVTTQAASAIDATENTFTVASHGLTTGQRVRVSNAGGALPTGLAAATNYYVIRVDANTIKFATTYALATAASPTAIDWSGGSGTQSVITDSEKEAALVKATDYMELAFADRWIGEKSDEDNALSWPRVNAYLWSRGDSRPSETALDDQVPAPVMRACAEYALRVADGITELLPDASSGVVSSQTITLPGMSRSVVYANPGQLPAVPLCDRLLAPYVRAPSVYRR